MAILNFPDTAGKPTDGSFTYEENDILYTWDGVKWTASLGSLDGFITEAPSNGEQYARKNEAWAVVETFDEAPTDGQQYARQNESWKAIPTTKGVGASAWARASKSGDIDSGFNLSVSKTSTGIYAFTFDTPMPAANYAVVVTASISGEPRICTTNDHTVNGFNVYIRKDDGTVSDQSHSVVVFALDDGVPVTADI